jgi:thioredoxin-related protein
MKNLFCTLFLISIVLSCTDKGHEKKEAAQFINDAVKKTITADKPLILEFWAPECGPCIRLKRDIFNNSKTIRFLDSSFVLVQVSA